MTSKVIVHKGRTNTLRVKLGVNVSADTITSEIRTEPTQESPLVATWVVTKVGDGSTGELILTLDDSATKDIAVNGGWMDVKRVTGGQPVPVFDRPLEVSFRGTVTE